MRRLSRPHFSKTFSKTLVWGLVPPGAPSFLKDLPIFLAAFSVFYVFLAVARYWFTPISPQSEIDLRPAALPGYAMFSVTRIAISYFIALVFSIAYGYAAAYNAKAERFMIPLLDTLQSIPVLSFSARRHARYGCSFSQAPVWDRTRVHSADFLGTGMEHGVQLLFFPEIHSE